MAFRAPAYTKYDGPRLRRPAWVPLMTATLKRGFRSVWVKRVLGISVAMAFGLMVMFYVLNRVIPEWRGFAEELGERATGNPVRIDARAYLNFLYAFISRS